MKMEEWKEYNLGQLIELKNGVAFKSKEFIEEGIPVIKIKNVKPNRILLDDLSFVSEESSQSKKCFYLLPSDILITMTGNRKDGGSDSWVGKVALFKQTGNYLLNQRVSAIRVKNNKIVDYIYLAYLLSGWDAQLYFVNHSNSSGGQANISPDIVMGYPILLPPIAEQHRIASILSSLDDKIELNRKINANLEAQAQALFKSWFVDFEPFRDGEFVESELGMIPEGWRVCEAQEVFNINIGKTPPRKEPEWFTESKEDNIWVSIADMGNCGVFISDSSEYLTDDAIKRFNVQMIEKDSILLSFKLTVGRVAIAATRMTTNEAIARFLLPDKSYREFLYLYLKQYKYENLGSTSSIATAVNSKTIKGMKLLIPDFAVIERFSRNTKPLFEEIGNTQSESRRLASLRDTLLPRLMSGELKVNEVI